MKTNEGIDATPGQGEENDFFSDMFEGEGALEGEATDEDTDGDDDDQGDESDDDDAQGSGGTDDSDDSSGGADENDDDNNDDEDSGSEDDNDDADSGGGEDSDDSDTGSAEAVDFGATMEKFVESGVLDVVDEEKSYTRDDAGFEELITDTVTSRLEAERTKDAAKKDARVTELETALADNPDLDINEWAASQNEFDYNTVDHTSDEHAGYLLEDYLQLQGYPEDEARQTIEEYRKQKTLGRHALRAKQALIKYQGEQNTAKAQAKEQAKVQRELAVTNDKRNYEQRILKTEKVAGIVVDPKERQELADYIMKPVDDKGNTQLMLDEAKNEDADLLYALIQKRKLDLSKLQRKAETKATLKFKKRLDNHTDKAAKSRPNHAESHEDTTHDGQIDDSVLATWDM